MTRQETCDKLVSIFFILAIVQQQQRICARAPRANDLNSFIITRSYNDRHTSLSLSLSLRFCHSPHQHVYTCTNLFSAVHQNIYIYCVIRALVHHTSLAMYYYIICTQ
uniref:Uncharacterized protein n=1 Tax=Schizaphis graminum TaxID=13262 RepID=A0A2S2PSL1_SCHGA